MSKKRSKKRRFVRAGGECEVGWPEWKCKGCDGIKYWEIEELTCHLCDKFNVIGNDTEGIEVVNGELVFPEGWEFEWKHPDGKYCTAWDKGHVWNKLTPEMEL
ncbi:MAG: hypothetical protein HQK98_09875 [Nitrospirae bacterium]|nr:hypothetical protein [Nitrospirota bacterium]